MSPKYDLRLSHRLWCNKCNGLLGYYYGEHINPHYVAIKCLSCVSPELLCAVQDNEGY